MTADPDRRVVDFQISPATYWPVLSSSSRLRKAASTVCLLALALLGALPAEHLHEAGPTGIHGAVVHRHLDDDATPSHPDTPADHDDHATAHPLSPVFQASSKFVTTPPAVLTVVAALTEPEPIRLSRVLACPVVAVDSPPLRLLPSRAPPARA